MRRYIGLENKDDRKEMMTITGITIYKDCHYKKNLKATLYPFGKSSMANFFGDNIDMHVIVGKNGSGKSSLLDIAFRLINNFGALLYRDEPRNAADVLNYVLNIYADLHYEKKDHDTGVVTKGSLCCRNRCMWLTFGSNVYWLSDEKIREKEDEPLYEKIKGETDRRYFYDYRTCDKNLQTTIAKIFFYTVATNYSMLGFLALEYGDEESLTYKLPHDKEDIQENHHLKQWYYTRNWISSLFHKNDGYMCPIVLNPYRDGGQLDMNNEAGLTTNRLASLLVSDKGGESLIENYSLDELVYSIDTDFYLTFEKGETEELDQGEMCEQVKLLYASENTYVYHILSNFGIEVTEKTSRIELLACLYLVYKVLHIAGTYPSYNKYKAYGNVDNTFETLPVKDEPLLAELTKEVKMRHSHIEQKAQQTLMFLNTIKTLKARQINVDLDWMEQPFEYEGYCFFMGYEKSYDKIEDVTKRLPPPIFKQQILLKRRVEDREKGKEKWLKQIPFNKLSSGEKQLAYQLTTIVYHLLNIKSVSPDNIKYNDINIVLDEIEVCFHPDYQRKFVKNLLHLLQKLRLNESFGIHILMTTHSPFILSDIPSSQIMYLEEGEMLSGERLVEMPNPFAANVSEILHQSFFLDKGFMGEFARDRILSLARFLNGEPIQDDVAFWIDQDIDKFLEELSEPYIKNQLQILYSSKWDEENLD